MLPVVVPYHSALDGSDPRRAARLARDARARATPRVAARLAADRASSWRGADLDAAYWCREVREPRPLPGRGRRAARTTAARPSSRSAPHPVLGPSLGECLRRAERRGPSCSRRCAAKEDERAAMLASARRALRRRRRRPTGRRVHPGARRARRAPDVPVAARAPLARVAHDRRRAAGVRPATSTRCSAAACAPAKPLWEASLARRRASRYLDDHVVQGHGPVPRRRLRRDGPRRRRGGCSGTPHPACATSSSAARSSSARTASAPVVQLAVDPDSQRFEVHSSPPAGDAGVDAAHRRHPRRRPAERAAASTSTISARAAGLSSRARTSTRGSRAGASTTARLSRASSGPPRPTARRSARSRSSSTSSAYEVHPALFDAALQLLIVAAESTGGTTLPRRGFLPVRVGEVSRQPAARRALPRPRADDARAATSRATSTSSPRTDSVLVEVRGLECRFLDEAGGAAETIDDWLYESRWEPAPLADESPLAPPDRQRSRRSPRLRPGRSSTGRRTTTRSSRCSTAPPPATRSPRCASWRDLAGRPATSLRSSGALRGSRRGRRAGAARPGRAARAARRRASGVRPRRRAARPLRRADRRRAREATATPPSSCSRRTAIDLLHALLPRRADRRASTTALLADAVGDARRAAERPARARARGRRWHRRHDEPPARPAGRRSVDYLFTDVSSFFTARAADEFGGHGSFAIVRARPRARPRRAGLRPGLVRRRRRGERAARDRRARADAAAASATWSRPAARSSCSRSRAGALARRGLRAHGRVVGVHRPRAARPPAARRPSSGARCSSARASTDVAVLHDTPADGAPGQSVLVARAPACELRQALARARRRRGRASGSPPGSSRGRVCSTASEPG